MSEEKEVVELKEEDLVYVAGGKSIPCDYCGCSVIPNANGKYTCKKCGFSNVNL